jgi:formamidopyrimidine-DNA glycosylase
MPELPEVEQVRRTLTPKITGQVITAVRIFFPQRIFNISPTEFRKGLIGAHVKKLTRRGKLLLMQLDTQRTALIGLGMTGRFAVESAVEPLDYLVAAFGLGHGKFAKLYDVRRFCRLSLTDTQHLDTHPFLKGLGWEFDDKQLTPNSLYKELQRFHKKSIKEVLLDQSVIAGIGNIYSSEILFAAKISPLREAHTLNRDACSNLLGQARKILRRAIEMGGSTVRDFRDADGQEGKYVNELQVYLKEGAPCPRCGKDKTVERIVQGGRSTFHCKSCQH